MDAIKLAATIKAYAALGVLVAAALRRDGHSQEAEDIETITARADRTAERVLDRERSRAAKLTPQGDPAGE